MLSFFPSFFSCPRQENWLDMGVLHVNVQVKVRTLRLSTCAHKFEAFAEVPG